MPAQLTLGCFFRELGGGEVTAALKITLLNTNN
jgi:hypothetical protein